MALPLLVLLGTPAIAADSLVVSLQVSNYNGFQVSCFGEKDGWVDLSVSGGTAPNTYKWSNGATTQDVADLATGYYKVDVLDAAGGHVVKEVTLDQPLSLKLDVDVYEYANGYNISCYDCNNGYASVVVLGGAPPFTVTWSDGPAGDVRYNLGPKDYKITVIDANGCAGTTTTIYLRGPDRSDWSMSGNPNTTPGQQYIGTPDSMDLVFKSNDQERIRLKANGEIALAGADTLVGPLFRDSDGILKIGDGPSLPAYPTIPCPRIRNYQPYWRTQGNDFTGFCPDDPRPILGTLNNEALRIITNGQERIHVMAGGMVQIGTSAAEAQLNVSGLLVRKGNNGDIVTSATDSTGAVLWARNTHAAWGLSIDTAGRGHILGDWNNPHPIMTFAYNKVGIGTEDMPGDDYNLFVSKGILAEKVKVSLPGNWPDFVFDDGHALMPMGDLRSFLTKHRHLPGIPAAKELEAQGGIDLGEMQRNLLKTVEEQALYILQLEQRQAQLEQRLNALDALQR